MKIDVHSYSPGVGADATIEGLRMSVPEAEGNRHWTMLQEWLADGNEWPKAPEPTLLELKAKKLKALAAVRWEKEVGGIEIAGMLIQTDGETAGKLTAARYKADADPAYVLSNWKVAPGTFISLDAATIILVSDAVYDHVQACFDQEAALSAQIMAAGSAAALDAIDIDAGW